VYVQMDPTVDKQLAGHVLQSHIYRKAGEADGQPLRLETAADVIIAEDTTVRVFDMHSF
jgi:DNA replication licensing factor MCM3